MRLVLATLIILALSAACFLLGYTITPASYLHVLIYLGIIAFSLVLPMLSTRLFKLDVFNAGFSSLIHGLCLGLSLNCWFLTGWNTASSIGLPPSFTYLTYTLAILFTILQIWLVSGTHKHHYTF